MNMHKMILFVSILFATLHWGCSNGNSASFVNDFPIRELPWTIDLDRDG